MKTLCQATVLAAIAASLSLPPFPVERAAALSAGNPAPEIGLKDQNGSPVTLASLNGKVVVIDFFASWCAPCRDEMPVLERLYKKHGKDGFVVIGVSVDKERKNALEFAKKLGVTFPVVHDAEHAVADRYKPERMPSSYVLDRSGKVRFVHLGFRAEDAGKIEKEVLKLLR